jgi:hypothetical protein
MRRFTQLVVLGACGAALAAGCSGGGGSGSARRSTPNGRPSISSSTTTTAAPKVVRIDVTKPIPGGSLRGTPRPSLENTGTDYVAIFKSLTAQLRWVFENPDIATVDTIYVPGTTVYNSKLAETKQLINYKHRWADDNYRLISVDVRAVQPQVVSLRVVDYQDDEKVVDAAGVQAGPILTRGTPRSWDIVLQPDHDGRWRIYSVHSVVDDPTVQL